MIRPLLWYSFTALSAACLVLCGVVLASWCGPRRDRASFEANACGAWGYVENQPYARQVGVAAVGRWSWPAGVRWEAGRNADPGLHHFDLVRAKHWRWHGLEGASGELAVFLNPQGRPARPRDVGLSGSAFYRLPRSGPMPFQIVVLPYGLVAAATALPPLAWAALAAGPALIRRRRRRLGLCLRCGYDLRASARRCSECGAASPVPAAQCNRGSI